MLLFTGACEPKLNINTKPTVFLAICGVQLTVLWLNVDVAIDVSTFIATTNHNYGFINFCNVMYPLI